MFDLFWSILNLILLVGFVYFFFKVFKIGLRNLPARQRLYAAPFLVFGLLGLLAGRSKPETSSKIIGGEYFLERKQVKMSVVNTLDIVLVKRKADGRVDPTLSDSNISGFLLGRKWIYTGIREENDQLFTSGSMRYNILGLEIMSFSREVPFED
ncbi:hypothetical protein GCM10009119_16250 [Algoriphagus jejuensis]|uniref:Uncharacterized protein n=1 Tax=Algoriphagus jejuensis TaxID=419934 RepID=A0ABP3YFX3_9BACT